MPDGLNLHSSLVLSAKPAATSSRPQPDGLLIALCNHHIELDRRYDEICDSDAFGNLAGEQRAEMERISSELVDIGRVIISLGCETLDGLRALASLMGTSPSCIADDPTDGINERAPNAIMRALMRGVSGGCTSGTGARA